MHDNWIIFSTAGQWQKQGIIKAKELGLQVLAIDANPTSEGFQLADKVICHDISDHQEIINLIKQEDIRPSGVISYCSEAGMHLAAHIRKAFDLPGISQDQTLWFTNKKYQRKKWLEHNVKGPSFDIFKTTESALSYLKNANYPKIIKPTDSAGSRGVYKLDSFETSELKNRIDSAIGLSKSKEIIIEDFIIGQELTVESFSNNGNCQILCITEKKKIKKNGGVVAYELHTTNHSDLIKMKVSKVVIAALESLNYKNGPAHTEVILTKDLSVNLVEVAARGGGFNLFDQFIPAVSGVDVSSLTILLAINKEIPKYQKSEQHAILRFIPSRVGQVKKIEGFEKANEQSNVRSASFVSVGDHVNEANTDGDRLGYILTTGKQFDEVSKLTNRVEKLIKFTIE